MGKVFDIEAAARFQRDRSRRRNKARLLQLEKAREDFAAITKMIIEKYNPARIYQWGSLITGKHFQEISDIDVAIEGITSPESYFALLGDAMKMSDFPLDIVQLEKIEPEFQKQIIKNGRLIYERS